MDQATSSAELDVADVERTSDVGVASSVDIGSIIDQLCSVVLGSRESIEIAVATFLASGHLLIEDVPGVGKTLLAKAIGAVAGGTVGRVQGTPDLLPSDVTGISVWDEQSRQWDFRPGPLFNNIVLVDELNRATPRTQSSLLEAMAEGQVSIDGTTHVLPQPFMVIATQNPEDDAGTFPLVAGERDRFTAAVSLGLPGRESERVLLGGGGGESALGALRPDLTLDQWSVFRDHLADTVFVHAAVVEYSLDLVDAIRTRAARSLSPRASLALLRMARAHATVRGRDHVTPDDIQGVAVPVLAHRVVDVTSGDLSTARNWVWEVISATPVPPSPTLAA